MKEGRNVEQGVSVTRAASNNWAGSIIQAGTERFFFLSNLFICYEPEKFSQNGRMLLLLLTAATKEFCNI